MGCLGFKPIEQSRALLSTPIVLDAEGLNFQKRLGRQSLDITSQKSLHVRSLVSALGDSWAQVSLLA